MKKKRMAILYYSDYENWPMGGMLNYILAILPYLEKKYEIDFMIVKKKKICPIEVKSSNYMSHKSFDYLLQKYQLKCENRFIIYTKDLKYQDGIMYIPIYMTMLL